eukprot:TRINITY_DN5107_c0_g1_i2.p1 TRINITY_DN5107_c0_g1~~TRINITY_DN5107_c0_g1_i2.p1  ORF type:complete len:106 (+),score=25.59 TRINITY_DN5107_c0_g1_i2:128-445(+)
MKKKFSCLKPILECEKCSKVLKDKKAFQIHMARTKSCVRPKCEKCGKIFKSTSVYKSHMAKKRVASKLIIPVKNAQKLSIKRRTMKYTVQEPKVVSSQAQNVKTA